MTGSLEMIQGMDALARMGNGEARRVIVRSWTGALILPVNQAKLMAPVDTGRLRALITSEVRVSGNDIIGVVGTNVAYAPEIEHGTGALGDPDVPHASWHSPPSGALNLWASRHGFTSGGQVAAIIRRRGGIAPRPFLRPAIFNDFMSRNMLKALEDGLRAWWEAHSGA